MRRARTARTSADGFWRFGPSAAPVTIAGAGAASEVIERLGLFLDGWPAGPTGPVPSPDIRIAPSASGGFALSGGFGPDMTFDGALDAANGLAGALIMIHIARDPALVCLHAGAALLGKGVIALAGDSGAGKSSLALALAADGRRLFGDDRIGFRFGAQPAAVSLGLAPKARLPLPPESGAAFARFIAERTEFTGADAAYLRMKDGESAPFGETAPLAAVAVLARGEDRTDLVRLAPGAAVRALLPHTHAPHLPAAALVRALEALARRVPVLRLPYMRSGEAADRLAAAFAREAAGLAHG